MSRSLRILVACLALAASTFVPAAARAQSTDRGVIGVNMVVLWPPLTGVGTRPLVFGFVPAGATSVTVQPRTPQSGEWRLTGIRNRAAIQVRFALPATLTNGRGGTLPISFNGNYAGNCEIDRRTNACDPTTYVAWNPVTTPSFIDLPSRARPGRVRYDATDLIVYLGGQVQVPTGAQAGQYTGRVTVTVTVN